MEHIAAFLCLCIIAQMQHINGIHVADDIPAILDAQKICKERADVSDAVYNKAMETHHMDVDDRALQCYTSCMFEELETVDSEGNIDMMPIIDQFGPENHAKHAADLLACQAEVEDPDSCVKGMKMYVCMQKRNPENFYFV